MAEQLITDTVRRFKGMNLWLNATELSPDWSPDLLNVIPNSSGGITKLRVPTPLSEAVTNLIGSGSIVNFQNAAGTRQIIALVGEYLYKFTLDGCASTEIDQDADNDAIASFVQSNNLLFIANGLRMMKWTGTALQKWGIDQPEAAPVVTMDAGSSIIDPAVAPTMYDNINILFTFSRTYTATFTWVDANGGETLESPVATMFFDVFKSCTVAPVVDFPDYAVGWNLYVDTDGGIDRHKVNANPITGVNYAEHFEGEWAALKDTADNPPASNTTGSGRTFTTGRKYKVAYGNSVAGHVGPASVESLSTGAVAIPQDITVTIGNPTDDQCDQIYLFSTEDGGADYYLNANPMTDDGSYPLDTGSTTSIIDGTSDDDLDHAVVAPLLNYPPPDSQYIAKGQGRIFVAYGQDIYYSGYERIFLGRPEESFPPRNRIKLAIGADNIAGMGFCEMGLVAWSRSNEMFIAKGSLEDITVDAPMQYSAVLDQLPYNEGCASHLSIAETPVGIVWLGADKTVKVWNGQEPPVSLSGTIYPLLRSITPGQESKCKGVYFNWLEKKWYVLAIPINGNTVLNRLLIIDLEPNYELNIGAFPVNVGQIDAMDIVEDSNGTRQLVFLQDGVLYVLPTTSTAISGMSQ